jgi:hypothetical protein
MTLHGRTHGFGIDQIPNALRVTLPGVSVPSQLRTGTSPIFPSATKTIKKDDSLRQFGRILRQRAICLKIELKRRRAYPMP